jgi:hypothetical protein
MGELVGAQIDHCLATARLNRLGFAGLFATEDARTGMRSDNPLRVR